MALLTHRDPMVVGTALASWIAARTGAPDVRVINAEHPSTGWSSETVLVDLSWSGAEHELVVRLAPPMVGTFRDYDLAPQTTAQLAAAAAGVAVASPELVSDLQWLGTPFVVMPRVRGHIIGEVAVIDPWLLSLTEEHRAQVHETFVAAVAATHRADLAAAAGVPERDNEAELDFWADYLDWSSGGSPVPALVDALEWCRAHRPAVESEPVLLWGDVRLGNVIFGDDLKPRAVLDWDMASIGAPEHDIAWFTALKSMTRSLLRQDLAGFPDRDGTIEQYESLSGRTLRDIEWYEILALVRSTAILARIGYLHQAAGVPSPMPVEDNPLLDVLAARIRSAGGRGGLTPFSVRRATMPTVNDPQPPVASVRILGGVHAVASDGSLIDLPSPSQRRLLAILALHSPRRLRSEWLADVLDISRGALRTLVSRVRTAVGPAVLETASTGYALIGEVDAARFCRAVADAADAGDADHRLRALHFALDQWNGPALEEFLGEEWADGEIARLTEIHAGTADDLAESLIEGRRPAEAVALLEAQIARYPYRDRARGLLIRALASAGRQADALRAFQQYRSVLIDESGTEPSPEVVRIERRVATGWDGVESAPIASGSTEPGDLDAAFDVPLPSSLAHLVGFVGRTEEMKAFTTELTLVSASGLRCVLLGGEAGIGKTTLLAAFAQQLVSSGRATVAYGRCDETGASLQPFRSVLAACVEHAPERILTEHVARFGGELLRICPSLSTRVATAPPPTESDDATERFLTFEAASDLLGRIAGARPLVLMLDDLQWAEPTALLLLRHLARALADASILLVLSSRDPAEHVSDALRLALADLDRGETCRLQLVGLAEDELDHLLSASGSGAGGPGPEQMVDALRAQTAGNPLFASQLIRHWNETGFDQATVPPSLRDVVWSRVDAIGTDATEVLTAASVLGVEFYEDVLLDMVGLPEPVVIDTLDAATRSGLLIDAGSVPRSLHFVHALVASALHADLGPSRRARLHGLAARALEKSVDELPPIVVVQLARHCALAGRPADAQHWSTRAGDHALDHLAPSEAALHYRAALDIAITLDRPDAERADLLVRLGDAQQRSGDTQALETLEEGARLAQRSGARDALVQAAFAADRGFMRIDTGAPEYLATVEAALAVTDPADVPTYARLRALLARSLMYTPDAARRMAAAHEALDLATRHGNPTLLAQVAPAALYALWGGDGALRSSVAARAIRAAKSTGDPRLEFSAHRSAYNLAVESADHVVAARSLARMRAIAHTVAEPLLQWTVGLYETFDATMAGRLDDAETTATATLELGMQIGAPDAFTFFAGELFVIASFGGRHEELLPVVEQAAVDNPDVVPFKLAYGIICAVIGREEVARDILREGLATRFSEISVDNLWMTSVIGHAVLAIELEDVEAAAVLLPIIEPFAADVAFNGVTSQGPIAAYVGKLASLVGDHDTAEEHLLVALETATAFGWKYHRATTLLALAQARRRRNGSLDEESEAWLREASDLCGAGGFRSWIPQIDALAALTPR